MAFLVLNAGSDSLKFQLIEMPKEEALAKGIVKGLGTEKCFVEISQNKEQATLKDHHQALTFILEKLKQSGLDQKIEAVGHRVVHGGELYREATLVTEKVIDDIRSLWDLAPLHNPANLACILAVRKLLPDLNNIAVFDTAFHQTLPQKAYLYGLPYELYEKHKIRKYGFHGISHQYVSHEAMRILGEYIKDFKILSCHLGEGASICAIAEGKSVEISMGFTPLDGLMMGTRSGSFDPDIVIYLLRKGFTLDQVEEMMQKKGGLKGISRRSKDVREIREEELTGDAQSELAFEMFVYRIQRFIGSYTAVLGGMEVLIFTGEVGEKAYYLRRRICEIFEFLNLKLDTKKNRANEPIISSPNSQVTVMVVPSNEELQIARDMHLLLAGWKSVPAHQEELE